MNRKLIIKFGGTSVGTSNAMRQAVDICIQAHNHWTDVVVVTSALSGVTDLLLAAAHRAASGDLSGLDQTVRSLNERHAVMLIELVNDIEQRTAVQTEISHLCAEFEHLCRAIGVLREASPRALDAVASLGERLSVRLLAAAIQSNGLKVAPLDSTRLVITDERFQNARPDMAATTSAVQRELEPLLTAGITPVVTGFIGASPAGAVTTLGRGGSDYSASILGIALEAAEVWIYTDVDGVMTADPRMVPNARTIPEISYREVAEMAYYGAKVLHPKSIHPVIEAGIPLRVRNTFNPSGPDTCLVSQERAGGQGSIKAVAAIRNLRMVTLAGRGMLGVPGVAGRIFSAAATAGVSIPIIIESTSEQAICFAAPRDSVDAVLKALQRGLREEFEQGDIDCVTAGQDVDIITLVCPGIRATPGIAGRIFGVLGKAGINVLGISYGASDYSINLITAAEETVQAVNLLHSLVKLKRDTLLKSTQHSRSTARQRPFAA